MIRKSSVSALSSLLILACPVVGHAEDSPVSLGISGHAKMYANYAAPSGASRTTDILRDVDMTFAGESTLANGLTVGALVNADGDGGDGFAVEDSFVYVSGAWGRVSLGMEDGAAFMLQVAAPSADDNVDGMETFINAFNFSTSHLSGTQFEADVTSHGLDYDNDLTAGIDKVTYLTPVISGFQAGISYTPDVANFDPASRSLDGNNPDDILDEFGDAWEVGTRYEGKLSDSVQLVAGAGVTAVNVEKTNAASTVDRFVEWNMALDMDISNYGLGGVYTRNNGGLKQDNDSKTWVLGADYTVGAVKYGASWLNNVHEETATADVTTNRIAAGAVYEYGPGLTFRGSVARIMADVPDSIGGDVHGTTVTVGTQILF